MKVRTFQDSLVIDDRPASMWTLGVLGVAVGLTLVVLPWLVADDLGGKKILAGRIVLTLAGASATMLGVAALRKHPSITAEFHRAQRVLTVRRWQFRSKRWDIPFQSIEMMTIGQRKEPDGKILYRMAVGTRNGERVALSRWKSQNEGMYEVVRTVEKWLRD